MTVGNVATDAVRVGGVHKVCQIILHSTRREAREKALFQVAFKSNS